MASTALALLMAVSLCWAQVDERSALIQQALEAYSEGQSASDRDARIAAFARAHQLFVQVASLGNGNADVYANAGTAALQAERLGPAILAFQRALAIDPDHPRALRNLAHARTLLSSWVPQFGTGNALDSFFFWHHSLSRSQRAGAGALSFLLAALALAAAIRWPGGLIRGLALLLITVWVGLLASLGVESWSGPGRQAVITAEEAIARASDSINAPPRFPDPLPGGTEVEVLEERDLWTRIRLANNREAWIRGSSLEMVLDGAS